MKLTSNNENGTEVFYDSNINQNSVQVTIPDEKGVLQVCNMKLENVPVLIDVLLNFEKLMIKTMGRMR